MKKLRTVHFIALLLLPMLFGFSDCNVKDRTVTIYYQHVANTQRWRVGSQDPASPNNQGSDPDGMWHIYMLRSIVNKNKDAEPFEFDIKNLSVNSDKTANVSSEESANAMTKFGGHTLPLDYKAKVDKGQAFTISNGEQTLIFIKQNDDTDRSAPAKLVYRRLDPATGQPVQNEAGVLMLPLEPETVPIFLDPLNPSTIKDIKAKEKEFENNYNPDGSKKN